MRATVRRRPASVSGSVALYLPRASDAPSEDTLVATATTAVDGSFELSTTLTPALAAAAAETDGQINLDLVANANGSTYHLAIVRAFVGGVWVDELGNAPIDLVAHPIGDGCGEPDPDPELGRRCHVGLAGLRRLHDLPIPARVRPGVDDGRRAPHAGLTPSWRRSRTGARRTRTSRRRSRWTASSGSSSRERCRSADESGSSSIGDDRVSPTTADLWAQRDPDGVRLHEVPNRALVLSRGLKVSEQYEIQATDWVGNARTGADLDLPRQSVLPRITTQYLASRTSGMRVFSRESSRYGDFRRSGIGLRGRCDRLSRTHGAGCRATSGRSGSSAPRAARHVLCGTDAFPPTSSRIFAGA